MKTKAKPKKKIIIIGAGISGLSAAKRLLELDYAVILLEGRDRIGGRINSVVLQSKDADPTVVDLGANFDEVGLSNPLNRYLSTNKRVPIDMNYVRFYRNGNVISKAAFLKLANKTEQCIKNAQYFIQHAHFDSYNQVGGCSAEATSAELERVHKAIRAQMSSLAIESITKLIDKSQPSPVVAEDLSPVGVPDDVGDVLSFLHEGWHGIPIEQLSPVHLINFDQKTCLLEYLSPLLPVPAQIPHPQISEAENNGTISNNIVLGGYSTVCEKLLKECNAMDNFELTLESQVSGIDVRNKTAPIVHYVNDGTNKILSGTHVICTIPLGVIKKLSQEQPDFFLPNLGKKRTAALQRTEVAIANKVLLKFNTRFWDNSVQMFAIKSSKKTQGMREWYNLAYYNDNDNVLIAMFHGEEARFAHKTDEEIVALALSELTEAFDVAVPMPTAAIVTRWDEDPYSCGSWLACSQTLQFYDLKTLANNHGPLSFAGSDLSLYTGTVHGGYTYGIQVADEVDALIKGNQAIPHDQERE